MAGEASRRAFAATWQTAEGQVVGTTWGGTMCWFPRKPWRLRIERDGFEHVIRCGECPGCLEFERRRLADRLHARYSSGSATTTTRSTPSSRVSVGTAAASVAQLFIVRIWAPLSRHTAISHKLHRRVGLELTPGMYRLGASSFALLSREKTKLSLVLRAARVEFRIEPVKLRRGRRCWHALTAGVLVARSVYGEQVKRWYARGLPPAAREKWNVLKLKQYRPYDRAIGTRAWTAGKLVLVPPEIWLIRRTDRRSLRALLNRAPNPESVNQVMTLVGQVVAARNSQSPLSLPPDARPTRVQVREFYDQMKARRAACSSDSDSAPDLHPSSGGEGYVSSEHAQGELLPKALTEEQLLEAGPSGRPRWQERQEADERSLAKANEQRRERNRRSLADALEKLRRKMTGGKS